MKCLGIIPARGDSKGLPNKHIRQLGDKSLLAWTVETARKCTLLDEIVFSSENADLIAHAEDLGLAVPFVRPAELSQDDTPGIAPVLHAIHQCPGFTHVVLLQPTSPFRRVEDIIGCFETLRTHNAPACVSVTPASKHPAWMYSLTSDQSLAPLFKTAAGSQRQALPNVYQLNGAVYIADIAWLKDTQTFLTDQTCGYVMPPERSIDIDTAFDLAFAKALLAEIA